MKANPEKTWLYEDIIRHDAYRALFREASADLVRRVVGEHMAPGHKMLEIGSGLGELIKVIPEYKSQIQQTELTPAIAEGNKRLDVNSNIVIASAYNLPFLDRSFDAIAGYSAFDSLTNLREALMEFGRVLRPKGKIIHIMDLMASPNIAFYKNESKDTVLFPLSEFNPLTGKMYVVGIQAVSNGDVLRVRKQFSLECDGFEHLFDEYVSNPWEATVECSIDPKYIHFLSIISHAVHKSGVNAIPIRFNERFETEIEEGLLQSGYKILESGKKDGTFITERDERHAERPWANLFHNDFGNYMTLFDPKVRSEVGIKRVKIVSSLYITIAQKEN